MNDKKAAGSIEPDLVRELAAILRDSGLTEIEVEQGELRLRLARTALSAPPFPAPVSHAAPPSPISPPVAAVEAPPSADIRAHPGVVLSPMVGTAYLSPEPGKPVFVKVGDTVSEGQTLMIVEAMKTFNPIPAPRAGKVAAILVADGHPIEFGEPLAVIE